jgi:hypothetical protein
MVLKEIGAEALPLFQHFSRRPEDNHGIFLLR